MRSKNTSIPSTLLVHPEPEQSNLTTLVSGINEEGVNQKVKVVTERPITIYMNKREIVTVMTIGDHPEALAVGFLKNQNMLLKSDEIQAIDFDEDLGVVVVHTSTLTDFEKKLTRRIRTSGCAQGTVFSDTMESIDAIQLDSKNPFRTSWLYSLSRAINLTPSLYLEAGAIHSCVLCEEDRPLVYMEDVGRHNAVDKIAGYMHLNNIKAAEKSLYTTGRLTSEMVMKSAQMGISVLISRSGFTSWGVELAQKTGLTLIGRAKGKRFLVLSGAKRLVFDADVSDQSDENLTRQRKNAD